MPKLDLSDAKERDIVRDKQDGQFYQLIGVEGGGKVHAAPLVPGGQMLAMQLEADRHEMVKPELEQGQAVIIGSMGQGARVVGHQQVGAELHNLVETVDGVEMRFPSKALTKGAKQVQALERRRDEAARIAENNRLGIDDEGRPLPSQYGDDA
jgi:hypothetical protein